MEYFQHPERIEYPSKVLFPNLIEVFKNGRNAEIATGLAVPLSSTILSTSRIAMGLSLLVLAVYVLFMIKHKDFKGVLFVFAVTAAGIAITFLLLQTGKKDDFKELTAELGRERIAAMDEAGIDMQVLSFIGPQVEDPTTT